MFPKCRRRYEQYHAHWNNERRGLMHRSRSVTRLVKQRDNGYTDEWRGLDRRWTLVGRSRGWISDLYARGTQLEKQIDPKVAVNTGLKESKDNDKGCEFRKIKRKRSLHNKSNHPYKIPVSTLCWYFCQFNKLTRVSRCIGSFRREYLHRWDFFPLQTL